MTIFGKRLSEYVTLAKPFMILIVVVGIVRLGLSLAGVPTSLDRWVSITAVIWIGTLYYSIRVHTSGFGTYKHLLPILVLQAVSAQAVIVPSIILAIVTKTDNIYSVPESFFGQDGKTWVHVAGHLTIGTMIAPLISWLVGCVVMFVTKKVAGGEKSRQAAAGA